MDSARQVTIPLVIFYSMIHPAPTLSADEKPAPSLVRGVVKSVGEKMPNGVPATLEIVHVYSGAIDLRGKTFHDWQSAVSATGGSASAPFKVGEEGIWILKGFKNELGPATDPLLPFQYRCRKTENQRYTQIIALAEAIEKAEKSKPDSRISLLRDMVKDRTPEISAWAVRALAASGLMEAWEFLDRLAEIPNPDLPLAGQIALDEVLAQRKQDEWLKSKVRAALLRSWVDGKADDYHALLVLQRIDMTAQFGELPNKVAVELARVAAENKDWSKVARLDAFYRVGLIASRGLDDEPAYNWLLEHIRTNRDPDLRRAAAHALAGGIKLYPARVKAVEEQLRTETDKEISRALREAIKAATERKEP